MNERLIELAKLGVIESTTEDGKYDIQRIDDVEDFAASYELDFTPPQLESDQQAREVYANMVYNKLISLKDLI